MKRSRVRSSQRKIAQIPAGHVAATALALCAFGVAPSSGCAPRIARPEAVVDSWVSAIGQSNWNAAYDLLDADARGAMDRESFAAWCEQNEEQLRAQAVRLAEAVDSSDAQVHAALPLDSARDASLVWVNGRWYFASDVPLLEGGDTPQESLVALAALLRSPAMLDVLAVLSDTMRTRYVDEIDAVAEALTSGASSDVVVFGDSASVTVGELTVRLRREDGIWRLDSVQQPTGYGYGYGY